MHLDLRRRAEITAHLSALGCDGLELMGDLGLYRAQEIKAILSDHGLDALSVTPESVDLAHPDRAVRDEAVDYYLRLPGLRRRAEIARRGLPLAR